MQESSLPPPKKQESDSLLLTTTVKKWGKAMKIPGRGEDSFSLADADTWPNLTSPQSCQPQCKHSQLSQSSSCLRAKTRKPFYSTAPAACSAQQLLGEAAGWVGERFCHHRPTSPHLAQIQHPDILGFSLTCSFLCRSGVAPQANA